MHTRAIQDLKFTVDHNWLREIESITKQIGETARINFAIPEIAVLHWPNKALLDRTQLLEDCVLNTIALETFHAAAIPTGAVVPTERLTLATDFVSEHSEVVRHLPPRLPDVESGKLEQREHRKEEIGSKLDVALRQIDLRLVELRHAAWHNLTHGVPGARLAVSLNPRVVDEHIGSVFTADKSISLGVVEPLDRALQLTLPKSPWGLTRLCYYTQTQSVPS